ncbi:MAG: hypothetical protein V7607_112 [Solirubrobacteraceae bacterium]
MFGDSVAQGVWDPWGGWVDRMKQHLHARHVAGGQAFATNVFNLGVSGDTAFDVAARVEQETRARSKSWASRDDLFVIAVGLNDSKASRIDGADATLSAVFERHLRDIYDALGPRTRNVVSIGLTPVAEATASDPDHVWSNVEIKRLDAIARAVADERGARRVEIFDAFRATCGGSLLADGIHPNAAGHRWLSQRILPEILDAVGEARRVNAVSA